MSRILRRPIVYAAVILAVYWIVLFTATHLPGKVIRHGGMTVNDKVAHFAAYALLAFFAVWVLPWALKAPRWYGGWVLVILAIYGAVDEWLQQYVPNRQADLLDWLADVSGAAAGILVFYVVRGLYYSIAPRKPVEQEQIK